MMARGRCSTIRRHTTLDGAGTAARSAAPHRIALLGLVLVSLASAHAERPLGTSALRHRVTARPLLAPGRHASSASLAAGGALPHGVRALLPSRSPAQLVHAVWRDGLPIFALAASNMAMGAALRSCGMTFSPALASMLVAAASMCALAAVAPATAERVNTFFKPGCALLARWLPTFYLPALVALARSSPSVSGGELLAFCSFCIATLFVNCGCTVVLMRALWPGAPLERSRHAAQPAVAPAGRAPPPAPRRWLLVGRLGAATALCAAAAAVCSPPARVHCTQASLLFATLLGLALGETVPAALRTWVHPIVSATAFTSAALGAAAALGGSSSSAVGTAYANGAGRLLGGLLAPTVVSFAFALYGYRAQIARSAGRLLAAICFSSCAGLAGSALAARAVGFAPALQTALVPRSITTPLALEAAQLLGADRELVLLAVCVTGLFTVPFGRPLMRACGVHDPAERGVSLGCAGNGGSTLALAGDAEAFPFSVIAMVLNGALTVVLLGLPAVRRLLLPS